MKLVNYKSLLLRALLLVFPISILVYNYSTFKLESDDRIGLSSDMIIFLVFYTIYLCLQYSKYFCFRDIKYVVFFSLFSIPAYLMSSFSSADSYIRYFVLIFFVPLGFITGLVFGRQFSLLESEGRDLIISVLMFPVLIVVYLFIQISEGSLFDVRFRDFIFGMVPFFPLLLYYRNGTWQVFILFVMSFFCIISAKRTGILCVMALILFTFLTRIGSKKLGIYKTVIPIIVFLLIAYLTYHYLPGLNPSLDYARSRFDDIEEDRIGLYSRTFSEIYNSNLIQLLFGHGVLSTVKMYGKPTHNDWLEITFDYGLLPFICMFSLILSLFRNVFKSIKTDMQSSLMLLSALINYLIVGMLNCMLTNHWSTFLLLFTLGFSMSNLKTHYIR